MFLQALGSVLKQVLTFELSQQYRTQQAFDRADQFLFATHRSFRFDFFELQITVSPLGESHSIVRLDLVQVEIFPAVVSRLIDRQRLSSLLDLGPERKHALLPFPIPEPGIV